MLESKPAVEWHPVAWTFEVAPGEGRRVEVAGHEICLWNVDGRLMAVGDRCPHRGASLGEEGYLDADGRIVCSWHAWVFSPETGARHGGEGCLPVYPVRVREGRIEVGIAASER